MIILYDTLCSSCHFSNLKVHERYKSVCTRCRQASEETKQMFIYFDMKNISLFFFNTSAIFHSLATVLDDVMFWIHFIINSTFNFIA